MLGHAELHERWRVLVGQHLIKRWPATCKTIALSSGEAELAGIAKGAAEGPGIMSVAADLGMQVAGVALMADSSVAIGICRRAGQAMPDIWQWASGGSRSGCGPAALHSGSRLGASALPAV